MKLKLQQATAKSREVRIARKRKNEESGKFELGWFLEHVLFTYSMMKEPRTDAEGKNDGEQPVVEVNAACDGTGTVQCLHFYSLIAFHL